MATQPPIVGGTAIGTIPAVLDSTDLASLPTDGMKPGASKAYNVALGSYFTLTVSTASLVPDQVVAVFDTAGVRWILDSLPSGSVGTAAIQSQAVTAAKLADWYSVQQTFLQGKLPQLTGFKTFQPGRIDAGLAPSSVTNSAAIEGGGLTGAGGLAIGTAVYRTPKTGKWGFVFRGVLAVPSAGSGGSVGALGLANAALTHFLTPLAQFSVDATHIVLDVTGTNTVTSFVADNNPHDFCLTGDGTTITLYIDGVSIATDLQSHVNSDEAMFPLVYSSSAGFGIGIFAIYGYVAP